MLLSQVLVDGFRCLGGDKPLIVPLRPGLNILVGENDSGKTALIDAIRFALGTRGGQYERISSTDFFCGLDGQRHDFRVRCTFIDLTPAERADFIEWTTVTPALGDTPGRIELHVNFTAQRKQSGKIYLERRTDPDGAGKEVAGALREYLQATYLRPLRDATAELSPGRRSRLAQILQALPEMQAEKILDGAPNTLAAIIKTTQDQISDNASIKGLKKRLDEKFLSPASLAGTSLKARIEIGAGLNFEQILERLALELEPPAGILVKVGRGLGLDNVLFMCAELLLLQADTDGQVPLLLVEEPEAHLHPQLQSSVISMLEKQTTSSRRAQIILTTHSPHLAAGASPESVIMLASGKAFPMAPEHTHLEPDDYSFLGRFLDATKANLFFAKGVLIVEGDAEALLLPAIAEKLGRSLTKHGVSIVNVGHRGSFRYARIFHRQQEPQIPIPVACIVDRDIPPVEAKRLLSDTRQTAGDFDDAGLKEEMAKLRKAEGGSVRVYISPAWTLEYDLAAGGFLAEVNMAIARARHRGDKERKVLDADADKALATLRKTGKTNTELAVAVYAPLAGGKHKSIAAEELAGIIRELDATAADLRVRLPAYLVGAIDYVTGVPPAGTPEAGA